MPRRHTILSKYRSIREEPGAEADEQHASAVNARWMANVSIEDSA